MKTLNVAFFGTPHFSTYALKALHSHDSINIKSVITGVDKKAGRGQRFKETAVATLASELNLEVHKCSRINDDIDYLRSLGELDLFIVVAFSQFLSKDVLSIPKIGSFNIHTSLLPLYRGAAPIQHAVLNGDKESGICIQKMVSKMDAGDIALARKIPIEDEDTSETLFKKFEIECEPLINDFIGKVKNDTLTLIKQDEEKVTFAPIIKKEDGLLDFSLVTAKQALNRMRSYTPWPGVYTYINHMRVKIIDMAIENKKLSPGFLDTQLNTLVVGTKEQSLRLKRIQLEGKKPIKDFEFINGQKNKFATFEVTIPKEIKVLS